MSRLTQIADCAWLNQAIKLLAEIVGDDSLAPYVETMPDTRDILLDGWRVYFDRTSGFGIGLRRVFTCPQGHRMKGALYYEASALRELEKEQPPATCQICEDRKKESFPLKYDKLQGKARRGCLWCGK